MKVFQCHQIPQCELGLSIPSFVINICIPTEVWSIVEIKTFLPIRADERDTYNLEIVHDGLLSQILINDTILHNLQ